MAERMIRKIGDPVLREMCKPVSDITPAINKLLDDMALTLHASKNRAGLSAPQIGIPKRIAVLDCGSGLIELINPEITEKKGSLVGWEGCLSIPGYVGRVRRAQQVAVKTLNKQGEEVMIHGEGNVARCIQHEIDHLNGILFIDLVEDGALFTEGSNKPVDLKRIVKMSWLKKADMSRNVRNNLFPG